VPDDIVDRLRFIVPIHEGRRGHDCIAAAADEIERLRREVEQEQERRRDDLIGQHARDERLAYLQTLIDAYAAGRRDLGVPFDVFMAAHDALLAAATPQGDDRE
jgi:hypothetical protein